MPLFIYVDNIEHNIRVIREKTNKKIIAVVKSNAYEMNVKKIIPILKNENVDFFAFEKMKEYIDAKSVLDSNDRILIMSSLNLNQINQINNENIRISINSPVDVINLRNISHKVKVHIRIDSGMNRFGIRDVNEFKWVLRNLLKNEYIFIEGIYTHFSSNQFEKNYFEKQYKMFEKYLKYYDFPIIHGNATRSLHKKIIGNYVRIGMGIYGYEQIFLNLKPSIQLLERPINIFYPNKNKKIGYSQISKNTKIGVLPIGYDNINLDKIDYIYQKDKKIPLLGKSCMNHTHFIANDKINYLTWLSIFPTNGIIYYGDEYNWYHILTSLKNIPKFYLRRRNYDISKVCKILWKNSYSKTTRGRSNKDTCVRIIRNGRSYIFCQFK